MPKTLREVARYVPLERCLIETDSPYLAPVPHRGKVNNPAWVPHVAAKLAEVKQVSLERVAEATSLNFARLFLSTSLDSAVTTESMNHFKICSLSHCQLFVFHPHMPARSMTSFEPCEPTTHPGSPACWQRGFDPNAHDESGQSAIGLAVREKSDRVVDVLLKHPQLDINSRNSVGETALMLVALQGRLELAQRLIEQGATRQPGGMEPTALCSHRPRAQRSLRCCCSAARRSKRDHPTAPRR